MFEDHKTAFLNGTANGVKTAIFKLASERRDGDGSVERGFKLQKVTKDTSALNLAQLDSPPLMP